MEQKTRPLGWVGNIGSAGWAGCPHRQLLGALLRLGNTIAMRVSNMLKVVRA